MAKQNLWIPFLLIALFLATVIFRPLMPVDETRYMSVAWEMYLRDNWLSPLTVNFAPYTQKPPLLFWLINASWSVFGVSRWAGTLPMFLASALNIYLTIKLAEKLFPQHRAQILNIPFLMIGSIPFLILGNLVMFDVTLTVFVLLTLLALVSYAQSGKVLFIVLMALSMGLGVLTKGPVMWLFVIFPMLSGPLWSERKLSSFKWYGGCISALLLSIIPILFWLIPVLQASSDDFGFTLVWEQTAGRISGNYKGSHVRPFYFYILIVPLLFLPWVLFPSFWKGMQNLKHQLTQDAGLRFILWWLIPTVIAFSFISGKQPHYLAPLLPGIIILISILGQISTQKIMRTALIGVFVVIAGQGIGSFTLLKKYNLQTITDYIRSNPDFKWAYARKYNGEVTFLARMKKPVDVVPMNALKDWFDKNPDGRAIIRYAKSSSIDDFGKVLDMPYRGKRIGIFKRSKDN